MYDDLGYDTRKGVEGGFFSRPQHVGARRRVAGTALDAAPFGARTCASGFVPRNERVHAIYNRSVGFVLLLLALPILAVVTLLVALTQGRPFFYGGTRIGRDRKEFQIYKFRTLDARLAQEITGTKVLPKNSGIETPIGKYLRASRLDELPQLFNIVRGDMNIVGPRPVRRELAAIEEARNPHYAIRFRVKPGLIGPTQVYMSHGTSKRLRARYNYKLCTNPVDYRQEVRLFVSVALAVLGKSLRLIGERLVGVNPRRKAADWNLSFACASGLDVTIWQVAGFELELQHRTLVSEGHMLIRTRHGLRRAAVRLVPIAANPGGMTHRAEPLNDIASHLIDRYLMDDPVIAPRPPRWKRPLTLSQGPDKTLVLAKVSGQ
ncbi:sugar transferase [uncultured Maritimibacter sp.]|jgi:lipopolysaccharide/colanic/teichoic acid biosynthesis glycosyltransferase|uniref:sugar transferase n=1 Tax=uncultured Maritimibacter sp. TaxID=991866 RepID=UPI0026394C93|nr:sugar transferase [uncultured Maritimibacter sp.]